MAITKTYLLRLGTGNMGESPNCRVEFVEGEDCPFTFMEMVIPNLFHAGTHWRQHAYVNTLVDGDDSHIMATLHEGVGGMTDMGAAYKTASLAELHNDWYDDMNVYTVKEYLDRGAFSKYKRQISRK